MPHKTAKWLQNQHHVEIEPLCHKFVSIFLKKMVVTSRKHIFFFMLDFHFLIAQVKYWGQTRYILIPQHFWLWSLHFWLWSYSLGLVYFLDRFSLNAHQAVHQRQKSEKWDLEFRTGVQDQLDHFTAIFCSTVGNWALQWNILIKQVINTDSDNYDQPQESEKWELENKDRSSWLSY